MISGLTITPATLCYFLSLAEKGGSVSIGITYFRANTHTPLPDEMRQPLLHCWLAEWYLFSSDGLSKESENTVKSEQKILIYPL